MEPARDPIVPDETLFLVNRRRFVPAHVPKSGGAGELVLHCGFQQIIFDEPELFSWAEKLIAQDSFQAGAATTWSPEPLQWTRVKDLLETLLDGGILMRSPPEKAAALPPLSEAHFKFLEAEKTRPVPASPPSWNPDPGKVLQEITGRSIEPGEIESIVPVYRLAHVALDREGRQVGEMNVFPGELRLKIPTEWKTCGYGGSRYHDMLPMNLTALRSMLSQWEPVLRTTLLVREEFLRRYPQLPDGRWRLGDLHLLSCAILALPALELMRWEQPVRNGDLDPVLSSLFRVTDGVRMVSVFMLDLYERPMPFDHPVTPRNITDGAERENLYIAERGVCAGPQSMVDEFVTTLMNGKPGETPGLQWAAEIPRAVDYALRGQQLYSAIFSSWIQMCLAYARIRDVLLREPDANQGRIGKLRAIVERDWKRILPGRNDRPEQRDWSTKLYRDMFARTQEGIRGLIDRKDLAVELTPPPGLLGERAAAALGDLFASMGDRGDDARLLQEVAPLVLDYLRFERNALRTVTAIQSEINTLLGRPQPSSPLTGTKLAIHHLLRKTQAGGLPYLLDAVREALDVEVTNHKDATIVAYGGASLVLH